MIYYLRTMVIFLLGLTLLGQSSVAMVVKKEQLEAKSKRKYANRRLFVRYKEDVSERKSNELHFSVGAYVLKSYDIPANTDLVEVTKGISLDAAQEFYREDPNVIYVEPDYEYHIMLQPAPNTPANPDDPPAQPINPNGDPHFDEQWGLHNTGQHVGDNVGVADVDINAPEMMEILPEDQQIITVIIDTGFNYDHVDLKKSAWVNPGEIPDNGIDDDDNGVIDDIHGFNAIENTGDPMDDHGHGSHCAGNIAAQRNNGVGISGVNPYSKIIGCKFLSESGSGSASGAIDCLHYVRDLKTRSENPVNIFATSNSWGGGPYSQALADAIKEHKELGILFFAAASNEGADNDGIESYPANYPFANVVSVAAFDNRGDLPFFSNYGRRTVHVAAPGVDILSTVLGNEYELMSGTSMATPNAAGLAGAILAARPELNYIQVKNLLMAGGVPDQVLAGKTITGRRIRAWDKNGLGSLSCKDQVVSGRLSPSKNRMLVPMGDTVILSALNINCEKANGQVIVPVSPTNADLTLSDDGLGLDSAADDGVYSHEWSPSAPGRYEFIFPNNDIVVINVYDPGLMEPYQATTESEFNYRKIQGMPLGVTDDSVTTVEMPFPIKFGGIGAGFDQLTIDANGVMSVTETTPIGFTNLMLPISKHLSVIAPYWDDLSPGETGGEVYVDTLGTAPNREYVVEWRDVQHFSSSNGITFQVVFFENSPDILFNYLDVEFGDPRSDKGGSATIGVQNSSDHYISIGFNEAKLENNQAIRFSLMPH